MVEFLDDSQATHRTRDVFRELETSVPWTRDFLRARAECYGRAGDGNAVAAARDLELFEEREAPPFLLNSRDQVASGQNDGRKAGPLFWNHKVYAREKEH